MSASISARVRPGFCLLRAIAAGVRASRTADGSKTTPPAWARAAISTAASESPPSATKSESAPTPDAPRTSAKAAITTATRGSRSTFPVLPRASAVCSTTWGSIHCGSVPARRSRKLSAATTAPARRTTRAVSVAAVSTAASCTSGKRRSAISISSGETSCPRSFTCRSKRPRNSSPAVLVLRPRSHAIARAVEATTVAQDEALGVELGSKIALKLLWVQPGRTDQRQLQIRLVREAQALAQLSHPNVISVYDVGTYIDDVFVAMELVEGRSLHDVLRDDHLSRERILELFSAAGRGLAAAHAVGLVHRDFKPENVAVGADGRVRVLDFGLARTANAGPERESQILAALDAANAPMLDSDATTGGDLRERERSDAAVHVTPAADHLSHRSGASGGRLLGVSLTQYGAVVGTPRFMAPEQLRGEEVDARADQFSFCVALYTALYKQRPFPSSDKPPTAPPMPPDSVRVPARLRRAVLRGLALDPKDRHPSMSVLLDELAAIPSRRSWWAIAGLAAVAASGSIYLATRPVVAHAPVMCRGAEDKLVGVWDPQTKARVHASFVATKNASADRIATSVGDALDGYTKSWAAMHTQACEATQIRGEQSPHIMDLRMKCLQRELGKVDGLVHTFAEQADGDLVDRAVAATRSLPPLAACADLTALDSAVPAPTDLAVAAKVAAVRAHLDRVEAMQTTGRYKAGAVEAHKVVAESDTVPYPPLQAEARLQEGLMLRLVGDKDAAEPAMRDALKRAGGARDNALVARAAIELLVIVGQLESRGDDAMSMIDFAAAAVSQAGDTDELRGRLLNITGILEFMHLDFTQAQANWKSALTHMEAALGPDNPEVLKIVTNLGAGASKLGKYADGIAFSKRALDAQIAMLGPDHPAVGLSLNNMGATQDLAGDYEASRASMARAIEIDEHAFGENNPEVARAMLGLSTAQRHLGHNDEALALIQKALAIRAKLLGPEHPLVAACYGNLGEQLTAVGRQDEAIAAYKHEIAIREKSQKADHPEVAVALMSLAELYTAMHRVGDAWAAADGSRAIAEKTAPEQIANTYETLAKVRMEEKRYSDAIGLLDHAIDLDVKAPSDRDRANERLGVMGDLQLAAGHADKAAHAYQQALATHATETGDVARVVRGRLHFGLARALLASDKIAAIAAATEARDEVDAAGRPEVEHWLATTRP